MLQRGPNVVFVGRHIVNNLQEVIVTEQHLTGLQAVPKYSKVA